MWSRAAIIVVAAAITYANGLSGPFVLDDQDTIVMNEQIRELSPSVVLFPARELPVAGRPVVNVSFALNYAFGGLAVQGYHIVNVAVHVVCALLLFGIVRRTFALEELGDRFVSRSNDLAFAAALVWAVHPLLSDAVSYLTQRTELIMACFYFLTFYASIRAADGRRREHDAMYGAESARRLRPDHAHRATAGRSYVGDDPRWLALAVISCALGMASKESMVTAPFLILVYDRVFLFTSFKDAWRRRGTFYLALAVTWVILAALVSSGPRFRSAGFSSGVGVWSYLLNQSEMIVRYLRLAVWPSGLVVDYGEPRPLALVDVWPYAAVVVALAAATAWALARVPRIGFLGLWVFATLAPTSSVVPIATEVGAERRMYLPLAALVVLVVLGAAWILERWAAGGKIPVRRAHLAGMVALALTVGGLSAATMARNREYASAVTLARANLDRWPNARSRHSLGAALLADGRNEEAISVLREAVEGDPGAHYNLGVALFRQNRLDEAVQHLREFLNREPQRIEAPVAHELIGRILKNQGKFAEADGHFRTALQMTPSNVEVHGLLAESLFRQQKFADAIPHYEQVLSRRPDAVPSLVQAAIAYAAVGRRDDAIARFRQVVARLPSDAGARVNLARALLENGDLDTGIAEVRRALEIDPSNGQARALLEAALQQKATLARQP